MYLIINGQLHTSGSWCVLSEGYYDMHTHLQMDTVTQTLNARSAHLNAPIIIPPFPPLQPFDRQALSVGGSYWKRGPSLWRQFPRKWERVKHSVTVVYGNTESHGHNHTPSASGMGPYEVYNKQTNKVFEQALV